MMAIGRLSIDLEHRDRKRVLKLLDGAGIAVSLSPVKGLAQPELAIGTRALHGLSEIEEFVEEFHEETL